MGQTDGYRMASWGLNNCSLDKFDNLDGVQDSEKPLLKTSPPYFISMCNSD